MKRPQACVALMKPHPCLEMLRFSLNDIHLFLEKGTWYFDIFCRCDSDSSLWLSWAVHYHKALLWDDYFVDCTLSGVYSLQTDTLRAKGESNKSSTRCEQFAHVSRQPARLCSQLWIWLSAWGDLCPRWYLRGHHCCGLQKHVSPACFKWVFSTNNHSQALSFNALPFPVWVCFFFFLCCSCSC